MRHATRLFLVGVALALTLGLAAQAFAAPLPARSPVATPGAQPFTCLGKVTAVDAVSGTVTVTVKHASLALQGSLGQSLTLTVGSDSKLTTMHRGARKALALADVPVGALLAARGAIDASSGAPVYDIGAACVWMPSYHARFLCQGAVSSVDLQGGTLVVHVARGSSGLRGSLGKDITIDVPASAKIVALQRRAAAPTTIDQITVGDRVVIVGQADRTDPADPVFVATHILVRHVVAIDQLTWFSCNGEITAVDTDLGTITLTVARGTRAVHDAVGGTLTLATTGTSVLRTLADGAVTTVSLSELTIGERIAATGSIDRSDPSVPVYDLGHGFVWQAPVV
jgi:hypothetical protein